MNSAHRLRGMTLLAVSAIAYGFMPTFAKMAYAAGAGTHTLLFLRFLCASAFMLALMALRRVPLPTRREVASYLLVGAVLYVGQSFCYFAALRHASSSVVALLLSTYPALVMVGSAALWGERITRAKVVSLILALVGAAIIIGLDFKASAVGIFLAALAAAIYALYILVSSRVVGEGRGVQSSAFIMLGAAAVYGVMNLLVGYRPPVGAMGWLAVALLALVSTVLAFWAFLTGQAATGPTTAALVSTLEPVVAVVASVLLLSEPLAPNVIVGGTLVLAALVITSLAPGSKEKAS